MKLTDTKPCISYEEARPYLMAYLDRLGAEHPALKRDVFARWTEGVLNDNGVQMRLETEEDALLASFWDQQHREASPREATPEELERYFKQNKNQYAWELPHFKGAVIRCVNKKMASRIKKYLKKLPVGQWKEGLHKLMAADSTVNASIEVGLFQIGKNACVDKLAFKCGRLPEMINSLILFDGKETEERSRGLYRCVRSVKKRLSEREGKRNAYFADATFWRRN